MSHDGDQASTPLTPGLYHLLDERFGSVQLANEGERMIARPGRKDRLGRRKMSIDHAGEYYRINCPFCNDTRRRLWINHCYGQEDIVSNYPITWLAVCYNDDCLTESDNRERLFDLIFGFKNRNARARLTRVVRKGEEPKRLFETTLPGLVVPLDQLGRRHSAVQYLEERGYDVAHLAMTYGIGYCQEASSQFPAAGGRIIIPIWMRGKLVGWQGRYVGDLKWKVAGVQKYYNLPGMAKKLMLYNVDRAEKTKSRIVVLVEGVTSVWATGAETVALLGKTLSYQQQQLIEVSWGERDALVVVILDDEAQKQAVKVVDQLGECFGKRVVNVCLPKGKDPGDYDREVTWGFIEAAATAQGIDLDDYR